MGDTITLRELLGDETLEGMAYTAVERVIEAAEDKRGDTLDEQTWEELTGEAVEGIIASLQWLEVPVVEKVAKP